MKLNCFILFLIFYFKYHLCAAEFDYPGLIDKMTAEFIKMKGKEHEVYLIGSGGAMMDNVKTVGMYFTAYRSMTVKSARILHVDLVESYVRLLNSNDKLRPYLHNYPCDFRNVHINTGFEDTNMHFQKEGIACVYHKKESGLVYYLSYDSEKKMLELVHEEPYEEAYRIVKESGALDSKPSDMAVQSKTSTRDLMPYEKRLLNGK